eukprot:6212407-Pleurochrysis_carterae.AAC.1
MVLSSIYGVETRHLSRESPRAFVSSYIPFFSVISFSLRPTCATKFASPQRAHSAQQCCPVY